ELHLKSSEPGKGSCFQLKIKLDDVHKDIDAPLSSGNSSEANVYTKFDQMVFKLPVNILLAEDSPENVLLVRHFLKHDGINIDAASNGFEALSLAKSKAYNLVLMDLQMPELDGLEATRRLRADGFTAPIIALTAHAFKEDRDRSFEAGCSDYLTKPINRQNLLAAIDNALTS